MRDNYSVKVSNLFNIERDVDIYSPTYVISMLDPLIDKQYIPAFSNIDRDKVLQLFFFDDDSELQTTPVIDKTQTILSFLSAIIKNGVSPFKLLVHCHAGASRSPAVVYMLNAIACGQDNESKAFSMMLNVCNKPWPNRQLITYADKLLSRNGRLLKPLDDYRDNFPNRYQAYMRLNKKRNLDQFCTVS
ncbi:hypothetical protein [Cysteiniphilum halobium]|uniref:hypothetical protein n=1 Tax=Cysteiniphilum halobium TaxID=2219059 RepID=UPI003F87FD99